MANPILATKLYIPSSRTEIVRRPRLLNRLNEGVNRKLTLHFCSGWLWGKRQW